MLLLNKLFCILKYTKQYIGIVSLGCVTMSFGLGERIATGYDCSLILMCWLAFRYTTVGVAQHKNDEQLHLLEMQRGLPKDVGLA